MSWLKKIRLRSGQLSKRSRAMGMFFATSLAARAIGISCQLLQVPIAMKVLGPEAFGLWMALTSLGVVINFADFGMGQGAQNKLAEAFAANAHKQAQELWGSALMFSLCICAVLSLVVGVAVHFLDFTRLFNLVDARVQAEAPHAVATMLFTLCLNFPLGLAQRLAYSRQRGWMHNLAQAAGAAGSLLGIVIASHFQWGLAEFILAAQAPLILANAVLIVVQLVQLGWFNLHSLRFRIATVRELLGLGAYFGIQQVQIALLYGLPQVIISTTLGAAAVTPYNLAQRLFNLFAVIQNAFMLPLWPAYSEAKARGEYQWIRRTLGLSLMATIGCTIIPMALGSFFAEPIFTVWIRGHSNHPESSLVWLLFAWNAILFLQQPFAYLLAGMSQVRRTTVYSVISGVLCAVLMRVLVVRYGQQGVVIGMIIGFMPLLLLGNIGETLRMFRALPSSNRASPSPPLVDAVVAAEKQT